MKKLVSIIMPTFMHAQFICSAIDSVLSQSIIDWELIIVNDGSTDNTEELVLPYTLDKRIRYFYKENNGVSAARNYAINLSRGSLITYLDSDDIFLKDHLKTRVNILARTSCDLIFGPIWVQRNQQLTKFHGKLSEDDDGCLMSLMVIHKTECFSVGLFNESTVFEEDLELFLKMGKRFKIHQYLSPATAIYNKHGRNISNIYTEKGLKGLDVYIKQNKK